MVSVAWFSEIIENPGPEVPHEVEDKPTSEATTTSGYDMTDNSAYRAGTQSSGVPAEVKTSVDGGDAVVNFDMTSNTVYSSTSYN